MMQAVQMMFNNPWAIQNPAWPCSAFFSPDACRYIPYRCLREFTVCPPEADGFFIDPV